MFEIVVVRFGTPEMWFLFFKISEHIRSLDCEAQE
jgi:hypothetical protein